MYSKAAVFISSLALSATSCAADVDDYGDQETVSTSSQPLTGSERYSKILTKEASIGLATLGPVTNMNTSLTPPGGGAWYQNDYEILVGDSVGSAYEVNGFIKNKYDQLGSYAGFLGYPRTDELSTPKDDGRYSVFEGGRVYYKWGASEAYEVNGWIGDVWGRLGRERSILGWPVSDEISTSFGAMSRFEAGAIYYNAGAPLESGTIPIIYNSGSFGGGQTGPTLLVTLGHVVGWGWELSLSGSRWTPDVAVYIHWRSKTGTTYVTSVMADSSGNISIPWAARKFVERTACIAYNNMATFQAIQSSSSKMAIDYSTITDSVDCRLTTP